MTICLTVQLLYTGRRHRETRRTKRSELYLGFLAAGLTPLTDVFYSQNLRRSSCDVLTPKHRRNAAVSGTQAGVVCSGLRPMHKKR